MGIAIAVVTAAKAVLAVVFIDGSCEEVGFSGEAFVALEEDLEAPCGAKATEGGFGDDGDDGFAGSAGGGGDDDAVFVFACFEVDLAFEACGSLGAEQDDFVPAVSFGELDVHAGECMGVSTFSCFDVDLSELDAKAISAPRTGVPDIAKAIADSDAKFDVAAFVGDLDVCEIKVAFLVVAFGGVLVFAGAVVIAFGVFENDGAIGKSGEG